MKTSVGGKSKYKMVQLRRRGKAHWFTIHRLVAIHFVANIESLPQVNHIDGNKMNNIADNLEWCTASQNIQHAVKTGRMKSAFGREGVRNPAKKSVIDEATGEVFDSIAEAAKKSPYSVRSIYHQLSGTLTKKTTLKFL